MDISLVLTPPGRLVACRRCAGQRQGTSGWRHRPWPALEAASPLGTFVCTRLREGLGALRGPGQHAPDIHVPGKLRRGPPQPGWMAPGLRDCRHWDRSRPHGGCVRPERPASGRCGQRAARV